MRSTLRRAALALLPLCVLPAHAFDSAPDRAALILEAEENISLDNDPTAALVAFTVRRDALWGDEVPSKPAGKIDSWQLQIVNSDNQKVSYLQGRGAPPRRLNWYGLSKTGELLPNGFYKARVVWTDEAKKFHKTQTISVSLLTMGQMRDFLGPFVSLNYVDNGLIIRIMERMFFAPGQYSLRPDSLPIIAKIAVFLKAHPRNQLIVHGFTDSTGTVEANLRISRLRAEAVQDYLLSQGIELARITYQGLGSANPIASDSTEEGRAKNRRVDILMLKTPQAGDQ
jgi:flagellar motor protein MotB